jgi:hypothetical protein
MMPICQRGQDSTAIRRFGVRHAHQAKRAGPIRGGGATRPGQEKWVPVRPGWSGSGGEPASVGRNTVRVPGPPSAVGRGMPLQSILSPVQGMNGGALNPETPARHGQADGDKRGLLTAKSCFALGSKAELNLGLLARLPMPSGRQLVTLGWRHVREHPPGSLTTLCIWGRRSTCQGISSGRLIRPCPEFVKDW